MTSSNLLVALCRRPLTLRHKLIAVCLMFALPIGMLLYLLLVRQGSELASTRKALASAEMLRHCQDLLKHLTQYRQAEEPRKQVSAIDADLRALDPIDPIATGSLRKKWRPISVRAGPMTPADLARHQELTDEVLGLINQLLDDATTQIDTSASTTFGRLVWNKNFLLGWVTASVALTLALVWAILRNLTRQMNALTHLFQEIGQGNLQARADLQPE